MSSFTEELLISQHNLSNQSSSITDSLTAKLDNMLHSSDEVQVQNSEFFKPSSNELTEQEEVHSLPRSDAQSVPRLEIEERNRKKYKSGESYTSLGTVVRHETPNVVNKKKRRPASAKVNRSLSRAKDSELQPELLRFLKKFGKKHPGLTKILKQDRQVQEFFLKKMQEFERLLHNSIDHNTLTKLKVQSRNRAKSRKTEQIHENIKESELQRIKKSVCDFEESCKQKIKSFIDQELKKYQTLKSIEDCRYESELKLLKTQQKNVVMENIRQYYDDKIAMFREKLAERKASKALIAYEHKTVFSEAQQNRRKQRLLSHQHSLHMLKQKMILAKDELEDQQQQIHNKIVQLYKRSSKSFKHF